MSVIDADTLDVAEVDVRRNLNQMKMNAQELGPSFITMLVPKEADLPVVVQSPLMQFRLLISKIKFTSKRWLVLIRITFSLRRMDRWLL